MLGSKPVSFQAVNSNNCVTCAVKSKHCSVAASNQSGTAVTFGTAATLISSYNAQTSIPARPKLASPRMQVPMWFVCSGSDDDERAVKEQTQATLRCLPFDQPASPGPCFYTGAETGTEIAIFAKAY